VAGAGVGVLSDNQRPNALGRCGKGLKNVLGQWGHQRLLPWAPIKTLPDYSENVEAFITD
jgi:hypothetical protein